MERLYTSKRSGLALTAGFVGQISEVYRCFSGGQI